MIKSLNIKNLATIENIELDLQKGFAILTGETGAGKSIIIDGIRLITGEKGSSDMIRTGKKEISVEAIFPAPQNKLFLKDFLSSTENELFIQRKLSVKSGGKGYVNGILVPIKKLKEIRGNLVDIYGQNDHVFLLNLDYQLNYLDDYANASSVKKKVALSARELKRLLREKKELEEKEREREQRLDFLNFQIKEIEKAQLNPGEEENLLYERNILKNAEKISSLVERGLDLAYNQENSISELLVKLKNIVGELRHYDSSIGETDEAIDQFSITIGELSDFLIKFKEKQTAAPEKLEKLEERLSQVEKLKRKYGNNINDILSYLKTAKEEYETLATSQEKLADIETEIERKFSEYKTQARKLSSSRLKSAQKLEKQVEKEIALLGMKKARFRIGMETTLPHLEAVEKIKENGIEEVEFLISPNPGEEMRPLRKIASGGELSRVMLALKTIGRETDRLKTLIFDEIDSGIGGKTAEFVAQRLRELSKNHQVICITHLPQIASFATHHYRIDKKVSKERTYTQVKKLSFKERVNEIARLLAGRRITEIALRNAEELLIYNQKKRATRGGKAS